MSKNGAPKPPAGLKAAGRALWADLVRGFEWEEYELHLVGMACAHKDLWAASVAGQSKRDRGEARAEAVVVARLLRELRINQATDARPPDLAAKKKGAGVA
jgi:hypothetical protein